MAASLDTVLSFLTGKGLTKDQAAGVAGNFAVESKGDPKAHNDREGAIGLAQWEGPRRTALQAFARSRGTTETDLRTQLEFLWSELQGPEHGALVALQRTNSAAAAAAAFDQKYERSSGASRATREQYATAIATYAKTGSLANIAPWVPDAVKDAAGAAGDAVGAVADALNPLNLFKNWQSDVTSLLLKVGAAGVAAALVIAGAKSAVHGSSTQ